MSVFVFRTAFVLVLAVSAVLLGSVGILFTKNYKRYLPNAVMICVVLFGGLVVAYLLIYWDLIFAMNAPLADGLFLDIHPFDSMLLFSLNWHIPGMAVLIGAALILRRKIKKSVPYWICLGAAPVLMCVLFVLAYDVFCNTLAEDLGSIDVWWL